MRCRWACGWSIKWRYFWYWGQVYWQEQSWLCREKTPVWSRSCRGQGMMAETLRVQLALKARACGGPSPPAWPDGKLPGQAHRNTREKAAEDSGGTVAAVLGRKAWISLLREVSREGDGKAWEEGVACVRSGDQVLWEWWGRIGRNRSLEVTSALYIALPLTSEGTHSALMLLLPRRAWGKPVLESCWESVAQLLSIRCLGAYDSFWGWNWFVSKSFRAMFGEERRQTG